MGEVSTKGVWTRVSVDATMFTGLNTNYLRWGDQPEGSRSGYLFRGGKKEAKLDGTEFVLGTFTHYNFPITLAYDQFYAYLDVDVTFEDGTSAYLPSLRFHHHETPNVGDRQEDIVLLPTIDTDRTVKAGGEEYVVRITGFTQGDVRHLPRFTSPESKRNSADVKALFARLNQPNSYISHVQTSGHAGEYVEILNGGDQSHDLSGWTLTAEDSGHSFTFPDGATVHSGHRVRVYTNEAHDEYGGYSYGHDRPVWNNQGDTAILEDADGTMISVFPYGG
ncbi:lamin tail domain-containing protein [Streptomyces sp. DSM 44917]|uniref:Lamin tail domain-containing protein n=1 Tax=Streptomyces boetiae TaxID=3075541 RepID=A0ABU2LGQ8_9ACTN|nr:lamin tail domain-containing protein [Streptomyces sp. DSM 44917]MDT0310423.1 lamin tail domain-containing protein [Streptomyces sp. DSM 44917]